MRFTIPVGSHAVAAEYDPPTAAETHVVAALAHGAGGSMSDRAMLAAARAIRAAGVGVVRFNFPYRERKSGRPDPMAVLQECVAAVGERVRAELAPRRLVIGGRSMGGRAASMLAAEGWPCDALLLLAYPLHPAGAPEKLRDAHLPRIGVPTLCINGTRDALCRHDLMMAVLGRVRPGFAMHWLDGADHSFHVLRASGRNDADVLDEVQRAVATWVAALD